MKMFFSLTIALIFFTLQSLYPVSSAECGSERPSCTVGNFNESQLRDTFSVSMVTPNLTVYTGQSAVFLFKITTTESGLTPTAYVDDCEDDTHCILTELEITCTFNNVNASDNEKEIYFYVLFNQLIPVPGLLCHNPPSYLTILGPPSSIGIIYSINPSTGLHLSLNSSLPPNTNVTLTLMDSLPLSVTVLNSSHSNNIIYPPSLLTNHTGIYTIMSTPTNPAGDGPSTIVTVDLYNNGNYTLFYDISHAVVQPNAYNKFIGIIDLKVDVNQLLTVPNTFMVNSTCTNEITRHSVNMTHLLIDSITTVAVPLMASKHNCSFGIMDEQGNSQKIDTGQSTFHTQSYHIVWRDGNSIDITCAFIQGSTVDGCLVIATNNHNNTYTRQVFYPHKHYSSYPPSTLQLPDPGEYSLSVYDYFNDTGYDNTDPVFTDQLVVDPPIPPSPSSTILVTPSPSPDYNCIDGECDVVKPTHNDNLIGYVVAACGGVVLVLLIAIVVSLMLIFVIYKRKRKAGLVLNVDPKPSPSPAPVSILSSQSRSSLASPVDPYDMDPSIPADDTKEDLGANNERQQQMAVLEENTSSGDIMISSRHNPCNLQSNEYGNKSGVDMVTGRSQEQMKTQLDSVTTTTFDNSADQLLVPDEEEVKFGIDSPLPSPAPNNDGNIFFRQDSTNTVVSAKELSQHHPPIPQRRLSQVYTPQERQQGHTRTKSLIPVSNTVLAFEESSENSTLSLTHRQHGSTATLKNETEGMLVTPSSVSSSYHPLDQVHEGYVTGSRQSRLDELNNDSLSSMALVASNGRHGPEKKTTTCSDSLKTSETEELLKLPNRPTKANDKGLKKRS